MERNRIYALQMEQYEALEARKILTGLVLGTRDSLQHASTAGTVCSRTKEPACVAPLGRGGSSAIGSEEPGLFLVGLKPCWFERLSSLGREWLHT